MAIQDLGDGYQRVTIDGGGFGYGYGGQEMYRAPDGTTFNSFGELNSYRQMEAQRKKAAEAEAQRVQALAAQGYNPDGSPMRPDFQSLIDPATGQLRSNYLLNVNTFDPSSSEAYKKFKDEALRTGPSAWANLQMQKQALEEQDAKAAAARQAQSSMNQGFSQLAMRGGLGTGTRTSLARSGMRDLLAQRQLAGRQGMQNRLGIQTTDEGNRQNQLGQLLTTDTDIGKFNTTLTAKQAEYNMNNLLKDREAANAWKMDTYKEQMQKWAANKQADATANSGGGGK